MIRPRERILTADVGASPTKGSAAEDTAPTKTYDHNRPPEAGPTRWEPRELLLLGEVPVGTLPRLVVILLGAPSAPLPAPIVGPSG